MDGNLHAIFRAKDGRKIHVEGNASARFEHGRLVATRGICPDCQAKMMAELDKLTAESETPPPPSS